MKVNLIIYWLITIYVFTLIVRTLVDIKSPFEKIKEKIPKKVKRLIKILISDLKRLYKILIVLLHSIKQVIIVGFTLITNFVNILIFTLVIFGGLVTYKIYQTSYDQCFDVKLPWKLWGSSQDICLSDYINKFVEFFNSLNLL